MTREESIREYYFRVNKSIDYIKSNLDQELPLDKLAGISNFSKFHFHRIFKSVTGMALHDFIKKARMERAMFFLRHNPDKPISAIAFECGFSNTSSFSRSFKEANRISATEWKIRFENSKMGMPESNNRTLEKTIANYLASKINNTVKMDPNKEKEINIQVKEIAGLDVIYVRNLNIHIHDSATFGKMFETLFKWAAPRGLVHFPETKALTVFRSNTNTSGMIQADVCLTVPKETQGEGLIGTTALSGGLYAVIYKEAPMSECFTTWDYIFNVWFENNGYQPDSRNFYISHLNDPGTHPQNLHIFEMYIPIKPL